MNGQNSNSQNHPSSNPSKKDELEEASQAMSDEYEEYSRHAAAYTAPVHALRNAFIAIVLIIILFAAAGAAAYWFLIRKDGKKADTNKTTTSQKSTQNDQAGSSIRTTTKHYVSSAFMLEFDYPDNWKVSEPEEGGRLTATSPVMQLKDAGSKTFSGQVVYTIRNKQQPLAEFDKGNAVAARESEKIDYTKPSSVQRGSTYLSFLRYATSTSDKVLDGVYVTGDVGYQVGQAIPKADFTPVDPVISMTFIKCSDSSCSNSPVAAGIAATMWDSATFGKPLKAMLQSLIAN